MIKSSLFCVDFEVTKADAFPTFVERNCTNLKNKIAGEIFLAGAEAKRVYAEKINVSR